MPFTPLRRRTLLQTGSVAAGALATGALAGGMGGGARAQPSLPASSDGPLAGPLVAWIVLDLDRGGVVRLVEVDHRSQPVRTLATETLPLMPPASAARRAHELAVRTVAASWGVRPEACQVETRRITHPASGRGTGYTIWTDFA